MCSLLCNRCADYTIQIHLMFSFLKGFNLVQNKFAVFSARTHSSVRGWARANLRWLYCDNNLQSAPTTLICPSGTPHLLSTAGLCCFPVSPAFVLLCLHLVGHGKFITQSRDVCKIAQIRMQGELWTSISVVVVNQLQPRKPSLRFKAEKQVWKVMRNLFFFHPKVLQKGIGFL